MRACHAAYRGLPKMEARRRQSKAAPLAKARPTFLAAFRDGDFTPRTGAGRDAFWSRTFGLPPAIFFAPGSPVGFLIFASASSNNGGSIPSRADASSQARPSSSSKLGVKL